MKGGATGGTMGSPVLLDLREGQAGSVVRHILERTRPDDPVAGLVARAGRVYDRLDHGHAHVPRLRLDRVDHGLDALADHDRFHFRHEMTSERRSRTTTTLQTP